MKLKLFSKNKDTQITIDPEELIKQTREKTAQQWMPIADIEGKIVYRKDDVLVGSIRVMPENLSFIEK